MFGSITKKAIAAIIVSGTLLSGGVALAQEDSVPTAEQAQVGPRAHRLNGAYLRVIMDTLDVTKGQIISTLATGGTLAGLAEEQGVNPAELIDALVAVVDQRLDGAVESGRLSEEQAAEYLAKATERITNFVNNPHQPRATARRVAVKMALLDVVMDTLDVTKGQIISTLATGGTLAGLAEEQGVNPAELIDALVAVVDQRLDGAVESGRLSEEQAAEYLAKATERISNFVNNPHPPGGGSAQG